MIGATRNAHAGITRAHIPHFDAASLRGRADEMVTRRLILTPQNADGDYAITDRHLGGAVGRISVRTPRHSYIAGAAELRYAIYPQCRQRGFATEAAAAALAAAFTNAGAWTVVASAALHNVPSRRVLTKIGMRQAGVYDHDLESLAGDIPAGTTDVTPFARVEYAVTRAEWRAFCADGHRPTIQSAAATGAPKTTDFDRAAWQPRAAQLSARQV